MTASAQQNTKQTDKKDDESPEEQKKPSPPVSPSAAEMQEDKSPQATTLHELSAIDGAKRPSGDQKVVKVLASPSSKVQIVAQEESEESKETSELEQTA